MKRFIWFLCLAVVLTLSVVPAFASDGNGVVPFSISSDGPSETNCIMISSSFGLYQVFEGDLPLSVFDSCDFAVFNYETGLVEYISATELYSLLTVAPLSDLGYPADGYFLGFGKLPFIVLICETFYNGDIVMSPGLYFCCSSGSLIEEAKVKPFYVTDFISYSYLVEDTEYSVGGFMDDTDTIFKSALSWLGAVADVIFSHPLLLFPCLLPMIGLGIGFFKRLI